MAYRNAIPLDPARTLSWRALDAETRRRLTASCRGQGAVLLRSGLLPHAPTPLVFLLPLVALAAWLLASLFLSWGSAEVAPTASSPAGALATALASGLLGGVVVMLLRAWHLRASLPIRPGTYLFAGDLIEVRGARLRCLPTSTLSGVSDGVDTQGRPSLVLRFDSGEVHAYPRGDTRRETFIEQIEQLRAALEQARSSRDDARLERLDPLWSDHLRPPSAIVKSAPWAPVPPWLVRPSRLICGVVLGGTVVGLLAAVAFATASEQAALRGAARRDDLHALLSLSARGGAVGTKADGLILSMALRSRSPELLFLCHEREIHQEIVDRTLLERFRDESNTEGLRRLLARAPGSPSPVLLEADALLLSLSQRAEDPERALQEYVQAGGARSREVTEELLPSLRIPRLLLSGDIEELWNIHRTTPSRKIREEIQAAMAQEYDQVRQRLAAQRPTRMTPLLSELLLHQSRSDLPLRIVFPRDPSGENTRVLRDELLAAWARQVELRYLRVEGREAPSPDPRSPEIRVERESPTSPRSPTLTTVRVILALPQQPPRPPVEFRFVSAPPTEGNLAVEPGDYRERLREALRL